MNLYLSGGLSPVSRPSCITGTTSPALSETRELLCFSPFEDLEDLALVKVSRKIGKAKLYKINLENPMVKLVKEYETELSLQIAEQEKIKMQRPVLARAK